MSLILEALRRSEDERRRRSLPALLAPPARRRRKRRLAWTLAAALAASAVALFVILWRHGALHPQERSSAASSEPAPAPAEPAPPTPRDIERAASRTRVADSTSPPSVPTKTEREAEPGELLRESAPIIAPATANPLDDPNLDPRVRERLAEVFGGRDERPAPVPPEPASAMSPPARPPEQVPSFEELPFELRRDMPAFRVSMIVAASDPAARFVLVEGQRRREGEELAPGIRVIEIGAGGLLLEFRGQRFRWHQTR